MGSSGGGVYRRIAVTVLAPIAALLLARIPSPGVDASVLEKLGGDPETTGIAPFALRPFMSAALLVEVLAVLIPRWRALRLGGYPERQRLWTRVLLVSVVLALLQAFFVMRWLQGTARSLQPFSIIQGDSTDPLWMATQILTLAAGTFALYLLARLIDRFGAGNGFAVLLVAFLVPQAARDLVASALAHRGEPILAPLCLAAVTAAAVTRLAGGRALRPHLVPHGYDRLPMPASGLQPVGAGASAAAIPASIAQLANVALPAVLTPGTRSNRVVEAAIVGAVCLLLTWLFNRPRLVAATWKRGAAEDGDGAPTKDRVRAAFARSLALALAICWLMMAVDWFCAEAGLAISAVNLTIVFCVVTDVAGEIRFRHRSGALVGAWPAHRLYVLPVMLSALAAAGIPAFPRARRYRTLWNFFAPFAPVEILVPIEHAVAAETIIRLRTAADAQAAPQPIGDPATAT